MKGSKTKLKHIHGLEGIYQTKIKSYFWLYYLAFYNIYNATISCRKLLSRSTDVKDSKAIYSLGMKYCKM